MADEFDDYVEHPRYGRRPQLTNLNPFGTFSGMFLHWHAKKEARIPNTAIEADTLKQQATCIHVTHDFDE